MKILTKKKEKKILKQECWSLDFQLVKWLNEHLKVYLEDADKNVDLEFYKFKYKRKDYTQKELIERLIEITDTLLGNEENDYWDLIWSSKNMLKLVNEMYDILKIIHFYLWW